MNALAVTVPGRVPCPVLSFLVGWLQSNPSLFKERYLFPLLRVGYLFQNAQEILGPHVQAPQPDPHQCLRPGTESVAQNSHLGPTS